MIHRIITLFLLTFFVTLSPLYASSLWEPVLAERTDAANNLDSLPDRYHLSTLDENQMKNRLTSASRDSESLAGQIEVPLPDGQLIQLIVTESSVMDDELSAKYPNIKTYKAQAANNPEMYGVIGINHLGFHGMLFTGDGRRLFIDRRMANGQAYYISYYDKDYNPTNHTAMRCEVENHNHTLDFLKEKTTPAQRAGSSLQTYRIAIGATGEYTAVFGGTKAGALSAINTTLARVNQIYQRDLSVTMTLVSGSENVIFTDGGTDPFDNVNASNLINQSQTQIDSLVGTANYDLGHVFSTGAGGLAGLGVVCSSTQKAWGVTGRNNPQGDAYDIDYVAHEIGHQFDGPHTFNSTTDACAGGNRTASEAYEPGSGSTIMAYAGICGATNNLQNNSDAMFHVKSIERMSAFIDNPSRGGSCGTSSATGNSQPVAEAGANYTIPAGTPFELVGSATDPNNGDTLTYSWEQVDAGTASDVDTDLGDNAIIRSFLPSSSPNRTIPVLSDILAGTSTKGVFLPTTSRTLNFALAVRDQNGGVGIDTMQVTVNNGGSAFAITSHGSATSIDAGTNTTVTWNAGNTASAPISCSNVDILLSTDGGNTFPTNLADDTANDGSESVLIPVATTSNSTSRIKVACSNNIFFDISDTNFSIQPAVNVAPVANDGTLTVVQNTATNGTLSFSDENPSDSPTVSIVGQASKGTAVITNASTGAYTYTPNNGELGADSFTFKANDGQADSNVATISITINEPNFAPVANNGTLDVTENAAQTGTLTFTDNNQGDTHTFSIVSNGSKGSAVITNAATGAFTYTPNADVNGSDSFTFKVNDGTVDSNTATITVTISSTNSVPVATSASLEVLENTPKTGTLGFSDADQNDTHTVSIVSNGSKGTAVVTNASTGAFTYTPNQNTFGADSFTFKVTDAEGESTPATISVNIIEFNHAPVANNGTLTVIEDSSANAGTLVFSDANTGDTPTATIVTNGTKGVATITNAATGAYTYTPNQGQTGQDTFTFKANDGTQDSNTATITVTINEFNRAPVATDGTLTVAQDSSANAGTLQATDYNAADSLTYSIVTNGSKGTATITNAATGAYTYTPTQGQTGQDTFTFKANDGTADSTPATITVQINSSSTISSGGTGQGDITVTSGASDGTISGLAVVDATALEATFQPGAAAQPAGTEFTYGLIEYEVTGLTNGATVTIDVTYPSMPANPRFYKIDPVNGYVEFTNVSVNGNVATLTLTDGGVGDADGVANGVIDDPIGLDTSVVTTTTPTTSSSGGGGSLTPWALVSLFLLVALRRMQQNRKAT